jgi:hypothetical protein
MCFRLTVLAVLIGRLLPGPARAAEPGSRPRSPFEGVAALAKPMSYTETKIPLGELVQKVAADTGMKLVASPEVADEPVAVVVKDLPARELLDQVADLLDYLWSRRGKPGAERYEIWQDLAAKQREEALRQAARAEVERRLGEEVTRFAAVAALPAKQIESLSQQYEQWHEQFFKLPPTQRSAAWAKQGRRMEELSVAHRLAAPVNRTLALLLGRLTPQQWATLRQNRPLRFSTDPKPGELLLPDETARAFRAAHPSMDDSWRYGNTEFAEKERQKQREMETEWAAAPGYQAVIRLDAEQFQRRGSLTLRSYARPLNAAPGRAAAYAQAEGASLQLFAEPADPRPQAEDDSPERRAALEKDPLLGSTRRFKRQPKPSPDPDSPANRSWAFLQELLPDLSRSCGINLIADAYDVRTGFPIPSEEPTPVYQLLDRITQYGYRWNRQGKLIRIRYRAWFFARPREVPLRIVRHLSALLKQEGELPLDDAADTVAALTDDQLGNLPGLIHRFDAFSLMELHSARHALRLYATFTPLQRQVLWQGQPFPFGAMTPTQRELFLAQWHDQQQPRDQDEPFAEPSEPPLPPVGPASRFALTLEHPIVTIEKHGDSTHFTWEPAPAAVPSRPTSGKPAAAPPSRPPGRLPAGSPARRSPPGALRPSPVTRRQLLRVRFQFLYTPELQDGAQLTVAPTSAPLPPDRSGPAARDPGEATP